MQKVSNKILTGSTWATTAMAMHAHLWLNGYIYLAISFCDHCAISDLEVTENYFFSLCMNISEINLIKKNILCMT